MNDLQATLREWASAGSVLRCASIAADAPDPVAKLAADLAGPPLAAVILFVSPQADAAEIATRAQAVFSDVLVIGCTTAGEITAQGYAEGEVLAIGLPADLFAAEAILVPDLQALEVETLIFSSIRARQRLAAAQPGWDGEFAFLMVDGMSLREDELASVLASGLGPVPLFGGSAGDGLRFGETFILHGGKCHRNAAVLTFVRTRCPIRVFKLDHLQPSETRMVVTEALPSRRIVRQINAEPAALEYARLLGKDPGQLTTFTFAAHPVVVRIGGQHHVRSIQQMAPNGDLVFFSAIDEGLVLTLAEPQDMAAHLDAGLAALTRDAAPAVILACDCILRRIEAQEKQLFGQISAILRQHRVVGFSTYGEQLGPLHVNQTLTGVAIYPPPEGTAP